MKRLWLVPLAAGVLLSFTAGCGTGDFRTESPTLALLRGDIHADEYRDAVANTNEQQRQREAFERNREPTRAYNTKTKRFEFVPQDTEQEWNPATERWEFTPRDQDD